MWNYGKPTISKRITQANYSSDIFSKYALVVPFKNKKGVKMTNTFQNILDESNRRPNNIWVDKGSKFYNRSIK